MKKKKYSWLNMRVLHRYLGFFLAGIMAMYSVSGIVLVFRDTDFLKQEKQVEKSLPPNVDNEELARMLRRREVKVIKEEGEVLFFEGGTYNRQTGLANYTTKTLPLVLDKMTHLHKANSQSPLFWLNISFGLSLFFFVLSTFWMFLPGTKIFKKGMYFTFAGIIFTIIILMI